MNKPRPLVVLVGLVVVGLVFIAVGGYYRRELGQYVKTGHWPKPRLVVADVLSVTEPVVRAKFEPKLKALGLEWPPPRLALLAFKTEARLEVWVAAEGGPFVELAQYPIVKQSGDIGPKRRQGDGQVPEGFYTLNGLNPNSSFHLSIKVDYPNDTDREHRLGDDVPLGGDIFIHGGDQSIGCLAMGDRAIEEIFTLVASVPASKRQIIIAPVDFRAGGKVEQEPVQVWVGELYGEIAVSLDAFRGRTSESGKPGPPSDSTGAATPL